MNYGLKITLYWLAGVALLSLTAFFDTYFALILVGFAGCAYVAMLPALVLNWRTKW